MYKPRMSREKIAMLVVGQEVEMASSGGPYGNRGKVVKVTPDGVDVLVDGAKGDMLEQFKQSISELSPERQKEKIAMVTKDELFRFDQDGNETDDSRRDRFGFGPPFPADDNFHTFLWYGAPECQPYYLVQNETVN